MSIRVDELCEMNMCGRKLCEMGEEEATEAERRRKRDAELKRKKHTMMLGIT